MDHLLKSHIFLRQFAPNKYRALKQACLKLIEAGMVGPGYFHGMCRRELLSSTYLDNGIAVPHGVPGSRSEINNSGMIIMQFPEGVDWGDNNRAFLLCALAANGKEHLKMLSHLACSLDDTELCRKLAVTEQVDQIYQSITRFC
ncbi:PTS sugar transporter subunit IIA [Endozoicomonas lisbonensis]